MGGHDEPPARHTHQSGSVHRTAEWQWWEQYFEWTHPDHDSGVVVRPDVRDDARTRLLDGRDLKTRNGTTRTGTASQGGRTPAFPTATTGGDASSTAGRIEAAATTGYVIDSIIRYVGYKRIGYYC